jgi:hypothetical protein
MNRLIRAELLKMRTTRTFYAMSLAALALAPISVAATILNAGSPGTDTALTTTRTLRAVMSVASSGSPLVLVLGILIMAGESHHKTLTSTLLVTPNRRAVVAAKLIAATLVGFVLAIAAAVLAVAVAVPWLTSKDVHVNLFGGDVAPVLAGGIAATALYALVGVGLGSVVRNQTAAIVGSLVWLFVLEGTLVVVVPRVGRWFPGGAAAALSAASTANGGLLPMWGGALLFMAYGLVFAAFGAAVMVARDVA